MWIVWPFRKKNFGSAWNIYSDFRDFIELRMGMYVIQDEARLPHSKRSIFNSICILLYTEKQAQTLDAVNLCAFELAFFQKDVGDRPLHPLGIDMDTLEIENMSVGHVPPLGTANLLDKERYDRFKLLRDADWDRMKATMAKIQKKVGP